VLGRNAIPENVLWVKREGVYAAIFWNKLFWNWLYLVKNKMQLYTFSVKQYEKKNYNPCWIRTLNVKVKGRRVSYWSTRQCSNCWNEFKCIADVHIIINVSHNGDGSFVLHYPTDGHARLYKFFVIFHSVYLYSILFLQNVVGAWVKDTALWPIMCKQWRKIEPWINNSFLIILPLFTLFQVSECWTTCFISTDYDFIHVFSLWLETCSSAFWMPIEAIWIEKKYTRNQWKRNSAIFNQQFW
jgi:hypothetical protein